MKICRAILFSFFLLANSAFATTYGTDATDLWWNANESGWGVNVVQQNEVLFLSFFVYGTDNRATWYSASAVYTPATGAYTGPLVRTTGAWLGTTFDANGVGIAVVGSATFKLDFVESATLTYSVDGVTVNKKLTRQTWRYNSLDGSYTGAFKQTQSSCALPATSGTFVFPTGISVSHFNSFISISVTTSGDRCDYGPGMYLQNGRMGSVSASYTCTSGVRGTFSLFEIEAGISGITGRFTAQNSSCSNISGRFGAVRN